MTAAPCRSHLLGVVLRCLAGWMGGRVRRVQQPRRKHPHRIRRCRLPAEPRQNLLHQHPASGLPEAKPTESAGTPVRARPRRSPHCGAAPRSPNRAPDAMASWPSSPRATRIQPRPRLGSPVTACRAASSWSMWCGPSQHLGPQPHLPARAPPHPPGPVSGLPVRERGTTQPRTNRLLRREHQDMRMRARSPSMLMRSTTRLWIVPLLGAPM